MTQFIVSPGAVAPLTGAMPAGTTIINNSGVSAVWIDSNPAVAPGQGVRLGPKGSLSWTNGGSPAYACLDTGNTTAAALSLSSDVSSPDNPVDVGVAVALQLGQSGIPISNPGDIGTAVASQSLKLDTATTGAIGTAVGSQTLSLSTGTTGAIGTAVASQALKLDTATTGAIGSAVGAQTLTLSAGTTGAIGTAVASQALKLDTATTGAIGSAVGSQTLSLSPATTSAIGTAVAAPGASAIASAVAAQSLSLTGATTTSIGTAVAAKPLTLATATTNAIGTAVANQSLTIGAISGGNVSIVNSSVIGNDVAVSISNTGVPSTYYGENVGYTNTGDNIDVSKYAAISVSVNVLAASKLVYQFTSDAAGYSIVSTKTLVVSVPGYVRFNVPVNGPYFNISSPGGINNLAINGTNRHLTETMLGTTSAATIAPNHAWTSGAAQDLGLSITTNGGGHQIRLAVTGSAKGFLTAGIWDESVQALGSIPIASTVEGIASPSGTAGIVEISKVVQLPPGVVKFGFIPYTTASFQVVLGIIPSS